MRRLATILTTTAVLAAGGARAADAPAPPGHSDREQGVEARLEAAQARLEEAVREIAELSAELSEPLVDRLSQLVDRPRAVLGVQLDSASGRDGARVLEVSPGGPAAEGGLRPGDVIVALDGVDLRGDHPVRELTRHMREVEPDSKVRLRIVRDGKSRDVEVTARPARYALSVPLPPPGMDPDAEQRFGFFHPLGGELASMELATLTPGLGRYFGTDRGVLVVRAPEDGVIALEDGDVILAIDGREPRSGSHAIRILRSYQPGEKLSLRLMRQRKPVTVNVTVPEARSPERRADRRR